MKTIIHLALKTGYSFRQVFGHIEQMMDYNNEGYIGISDSGNTFSQYEIEMLCKDNKELKPIYGVRLTVVKNGTTQVKPRGQFGCEYIFIAKNDEGLKEIYNLCKINYDNFYYRGNLSFRDVESLSDSVIVIAEDVQCTDRLDYIALTTTTPGYMYDVGLEESIPFVAIVNNYYPKAEDHETYEILVGSRNSCNQTYPQHILSTQEWFEFQYEKGRSDENLISAIDNTHVIAKQCDRIMLPKAPMIKASSKQSMEFLCKIGAKNKNIDLTEGEYADRYENELKLIKERGFDDYFLVVADMISKAKKKMLVGPGRGCFLPDNRVRMRKGNLKKIQDVEIGNTVIDAFGCARKVLETFEYDIDEEILEIEFEDETVISCTPDHKILTLSGWKRADELTKKDVICDIMSNNIKKASLIAAGVNEMLVHKISEFGFVSYDDYISNDFLDNSIIKVQFKCIDCKKDQAVQIRRLRSRQESLVNEKICNNCIIKVSSNTEEAIENNKNAQRKRHQYGRYTT